MCILENCVEKYTFLNSCFGKWTFSWSCKKKFNFEQLNYLCPFLVYFSWRERDCSDYQIEDAVREIRLTLFHYKEMECWKENERGVESAFYLNDVKGELLLRVGSSPSHPTTLWYRSPSSFINAPLLFPFFRLARECRKVF